MSDKERQFDEMFALKSIFLPDEFKSKTCHFIEIRDDTYYRGQICVSVLIDNGFTVVIKDFCEDESRDIKLCLSYLPPIQVDFELPKNYPSKSPPIFSLLVPWLTNDKMNKLSNKLIDLWIQHKGSEILYIWALFLKQETLSFLNSTEVLTIRLNMFRTDLFTFLQRKRYRYPSFNVAHHKLYIALLDYNMNTRKNMLLKTSLICKNCSKVSSGKLCVFVTPCEHVFCKNCITTYMKKLTAEYKIRSFISCPRIGCKSGVSLCEILELVTDDVHKSVDETKQGEN